MVQRGKLPLIVKVVTTLGVISVVTGCGNTTARETSDLATHASQGAEAYVCNFGYDDQPGSTITAVDLSLIHI